MYRYMGPEVARLNRLKLQAEERRNTYAHKAEVAGVLAVAGLGLAGLAFAATSVVGWSSFIAAPYPHTIAEGPVVSPLGALIVADVAGLTVAPAVGVIETINWAHNRDLKQKESANVALLEAQLKAAQEGVLK